MVNSTAMEAKKVKHLNIEKLAKSIKEHRGAFLMRNGVYAFQFPDINWLLYVLVFGLVWAPLFSHLHKFCASLIESNHE